MDRRRREEKVQGLSETVSISLERELSIISNDSSTSFCALWSVNVDDWWTHHPTWELTQQNTTHQCFRRIPNEQQRQLYQRLYAIQFPSSSCPHSTTSILTKHCTGSGWGVDVSHMVDGLQLALAQSVLVRILTPLPWQYAGGCPRADASCYFLPFSICDAEPREALPPGQRSPTIRYQQPWRGFAPREVFMSDQQLDNGDDDDDDIAKEDSAIAMDWTVPWLLQYATRAQTWLRHRVVQATMEHLVGPPPPPSSSNQQQQLQQPLTPCIVMHVRRADVVLHGKFSRRYHAIREYVHALEQHYYDWWNNSTHHNILLLTDDANAIQEARTEYPPNPEFKQNNHNHNNNNIQWFYLDRPRHQADEGGWENQIPSGDAVTDVVMLLAGVELAARHCHTLVHSKSNLADYLYASMLLAAAAREPPQQDASTTTTTSRMAVERIDLDENQPHQSIHQAANAESVHISTAFG